MAKAVKSPNFDANLDGNRMATKAKRNLLEVAIVAGESSNARAPLDTGALRQSKRLVKGTDSVSNVWQVFGKTPRKPRSRNSRAKYPADYAHVRYYTNTKHPNTTEWALKDYEQNEEKYLELMSRGVIK